MALQEQPVFNALDVMQAAQFIRFPEGESLTDEDIRRKLRRWYLCLPEHDIREMTEKVREGGTGSYHWDWGQVDRRSLTQPTATSFPRDFDMNKLQEELIHEYAKDGTQSVAYSNWGASGYEWTQEDYVDPGFAFMYTDRHFSNRSRATFTVMKLLQKFYKEGLRSFCSKTVDILDFGAGPGCAAAGVMMYCRQELTKMKQVVFYDPVKKWKPALQFYNSLAHKWYWLDLKSTGYHFSPSYPRVNFTYHHDMECAWASLNVFKKEQGTVIVCLSYILRDMFGHRGGNPQTRNNVFDYLREEIGDRRALILILERFPCKEFLPEPPPKTSLEGELVLPDGRAMFYAAFEMEPTPSDSRPAKLRRTGDPSMTTAN
eukprot:Skav202437  [mRNA]  locus=scaffold2070:80171:81289:+ [translate_table: standard]